MTDRAPIGRRRSSTSSSRRASRRPSSSSARTARPTRGLVQRVLAEGHEIGNHTFTHPNLGEDLARGGAPRDQRHATPGRGADGPLDAAVPAAVLRRRGADDAERDRARQAGADARLRHRRPARRSRRLAGAAGRPDRQARHGPHGRYQPGDARPGRAAARCGRRPLADRRGAAAHHRRRCAPRASRSCRCRQLAGWTFDQVMPPLPPEDHSALVNWYVFITASWLQATMHWLFMLAIGLGLARLVALCGLALWSRYKAVPPPPLVGERRRCGLGSDPRLQRGQGHRRLGRAHPRQPSMPRSRSSSSTTDRPTAPATSCASASAPIRA